MRPVVVGAHHQVQLIGERGECADDKALVRVAVFDILHVRGGYGQFPVDLALAGHVDLVVAEGEGQVRADRGAPVQGRSQDQVNSLGFHIQGVGEERNIGTQGPDVVTVRRNAVRMGRWKRAAGLVDAVVDLYLVEVHGQGRVGAAEQVRQVGGKTHTEVDRLLHLQRRAAGRLHQRVSGRKSSFFHRYVEIGVEGGGHLAYV